MSVIAAPIRVSLAYQNWHRFSRNPTALIGAAIVLIVVLAALLAPWIAPHPDHVGAVVNFRARHQPPSAQYWFGTDNVGRDIFSRVLFGYRISLLLAAVVLGLAVPFGVTLGLAFASTGALFPFNSSSRGSPQTKSGSTAACVASSPASIR